MKRKEYLLLILMMTVFMLTNCQTKSKENGKQEAKLEFETFKDFPDGIDGCSCFFSKNDKEFSEEKYIYVNNYANISFIKIQGEFKKFIEIDSSKPEDEKRYNVYKYNDFILRIDITKSVTDGYESSKIYGQMTLTDKDGRKITQEFVGICGC